MSLLTPGKTRLDSWKEVAAWFGRGERTVKRWEAERGLPVHRLPGRAKSGVYAEIAELEAWRRGAAAALAEPEPSAADPPALAPAGGGVRPSGTPWVLAVVVVAIVVIALILNEPGVTGPGARTAIAKTPRPAPLAAQRLYLAGMDDWDKRTPASLNRAADEFNAAIARDPGYAEAYAGLAGCYDLMREYTLMPPSQAYPLARAAAKHALALDDRLADAHAALAFADFYGFWDAAGARREFARAIALDRRSETAHHWFATFLMVQGDGAGALRQIDAAQALDPASLPIAEDRYDILWHAGQKASAVAGLKAIEAAHPRLVSAHGYLSEFYLVRGRDREFLAEAAVLARLSDYPPRLAAAAAAAERGLASNGREGMLRAMIATETQLFVNGAGSAYEIARAYALLGDRQKAMDYLATAFSRRDSKVTYIGIDPAFATLRGDPAFQRLARRIVA